MKYIVAISLIIVSSMMLSCGKVGVITFYEEFNEKVSVPQAVLPASTDTFSSPLIATNVAAQMKANNTSTALVQSVRLQTATLTITTPPGQTFAFLQNVRVFIFTDSLPTVEVASDYTISPTSDTLNMNIDAVELKPYLISNTFGMKFIATNNAVVTPGMTLNACLRFKFQANLLAVLLFPISFFGCHPYQAEVSL